MEKLVSMLKNHTSSGMPSLPEDQVSVTDSANGHSDSDLSEKLGDVHMNILPRRKLIVCFATMALGLFVSFSDQASVTVALSSIAKDLNAELTINWAGTASLLATCVFGVLFGRFADIFGRKTMLLASLGILCVANLLCGFAKTGVQFYVYRAFAGTGSGGVQSLSMVLVSDMVTLRQRGKFQGILGSMIGVANSAAPLIMAGFIESSTWRNFYRLMPPLIVTIMVAIYFLIEDKKKELNQVLSSKEKFRKIDYLGILFSTSALVLLLVPISGGGTTYAWNSQLVIVMFCFGGSCLITFLLVEWKIPKLPMMPLRLFNNLSLACILFQHFFYGMVHYSFLFFCPYYFQIVRDFSYIKSSLLTIPLVMTSSIASIIAGYTISIIGRYIPIIYSGYATWLLAVCLLMVWNKSTPIGAVVVILFIMGIGLGFIFQPTMLAAQAQSKLADRAVVISTRNVIRSFGAALGISIASLIMSNTLIRDINAKLAAGDSGLPSSYLTYMKSHIYSKIDPKGLTHDQINLVRDMYMKAMRNIFYLLIPLIAICLISCVTIKDRGLQCIDEQPIQKPKDEEQPEQEESTKHQES